MGLLNCLAFCEVLLVDVNGPLNYLANNMSQFTENNYLIYHIQLFMLNMFKFVYNKTIYRLL